MTNQPRKGLHLTDGEGRETDKPSSFVSIGDLVQKIVAKTGQSRVRNDNQEAAKAALPKVKEG
tara:strand:+ start:1209 stop:1397 length:189 start_codon:yes stop_codon:yes gene_type:complete